MTHLLKTLLFLLSLGVIDFYINIFPLKAITVSQNIIVQNSENEKYTEAEKLYEQLFSLYQQGKYKEAIPIAEKIIVLAKELVGEKHPDTAEAINNLGTLYREIGDYKKAEDYYQQALSIYREVVGNKHPGTASSLNTLAGLYYYQGKYQEAEKIYQEVLAIQREVLGDKDIATATTLNNLALLYQNQGNYEGAQPLYEEALQVYFLVLGENHPDTATAMNNLGLLYQYQGDYQKAQNFYERALTVRKQVSGQKSPDVAQTLNNMALLAENKGDYPRAEALYKEAIAIYREVLGNNHPDTATSLNNLGLLYYYQGNYIAAEPLFKETLAIRQQILGAKHPDVALSLNNLALLYHSQGNHQEAESLYQDAIAIQKEVLGKNHPNTATSLNNLGELYRIQGNYESAQPLYQESLSIRLKVLGEKHPDTAQSLNNLALLYYSLGDYQTAEELYQQALKIHQEVLGEKHPFTATSFNNLGELYRIQGKYETAAPFYQQSLTIRKEILGENHPDVAQSFNNLALLYYNQGNYQSAEPLYKQAITIQQKVFGENHPDNATYLNNLAMVYWATDKLDSTLDYLTQGANVEEFNLAEFLNSSGDELRKQAYINTLYGTTNWTVSLHLNYAPENQKATDLALTTILRRKGRVLDAMSNIVSTLRQNSNPETEKIFNTLAEKRSQLASLTLQGVGKMSPTLYGELIASLEQNIRQLETDLSNNSAEFRTLNEEITLSTIAQQIPENTVLVEYIVYYPFEPKTETWGKPRYGVYVLDHNGKSQGIDLGETEIIDQLVEHFRGNLAYGDISDLDNLKKYAQQLYKLIFEPLLPLLNNKKTLLVSPDSQLNLIPFAALQDNQGKYLVEDYSISYLTSGRDLLRLKTKFQSQSQAIIVANPIYDLKINDDTNFMAMNRGANLRGGDLDALQWCCTALSGTKAEAEAIIPLLSQPLVYTEKDAHTTNITRIKAPKILHLATHGFFLPDVKNSPPPTLSDTQNNLEANIITSENPLLRSGLALTGFNPQGNQMSGALTALDASSLYLWGTKLVVLSACQTGVGEVKNGDGVYGLRRAFVLAGAESQLMSLWDVYDEGTKDLMIKYYQKLTQGEGRSEALRNVQLEMLKSEKYYHPVFWAAFIPSGDWRTIE
ncbi:CHAT domain-containing tetratricopeptide repeat protein [Cyanobacterium aponinum]|uniref:Tetratricopeptide TPR_1 repeat-containing protein n=1 Tax=Cyanobacterium aponinum (strain PCC 10605) TaxID=755178 RepID=K9Z8T9_CYAAP|nr:CHAT domain-containing protein [Cyanobacterium aponinum]AFZ55137.1 Tetratricopeptide TPR_1 repeat-containing protein [Cyanobacterium aponinum PCC 10605]